MGRLQLLPRPSPVPRMLTEMPASPTETSAKTAKLSLAKTIAKAVVREMAKAHAHYQAILNERGTTTIQTSLKVSSEANGSKIIDPFDCTKDKSI